MSEQHDFQLDERIRRAHELTPEATQRVLELWPSIESTFVEERPVMAPRRRAARRRVLVIAVIAALIVGVAAAAVAGPLRHIFWDSENEPARGQVTEPSTSASQLLAGRSARTSTDPADRAMINAMVDRSRGINVPKLAASAPTQVVTAPKIDRRLVFVETSNGSFCFHMDGGQIGIGGCAGDFGSNGVMWRSGTVDGIVLIEGFVAADVTRLQVELRSGAVEQIPIDHGMFTWSEGRRAAPQQAVGFIATRAGELIHAPLTLDPSDRQASISR